jgi:bacterioferritin-associated ferredoxin
MIVCVCRGVSDRAIRAALDSGANGPDAIAGATGAGTDCGCCRDTIEAMVARAAPCSSPPCAGCPRAGRAAGAS